jgi:hypothetical protein
MNLVRRLRRLGAAVAGLACALLALAAAAPAAFAGSAPPSPPMWDHKPIPLPPEHQTGPVYKVPVHTVVIGGMPGWQIALIAAGAALLAATAAVVVYRAWATRRKPLTATA